MLLLLLFGVFPPVFISLLLSLFFLCDWFEYCRTTICCWCCCRCCPVYLFHNNLHIQYRLCSASHELFAADIIKGGRGMGRSVIQHLIEKYHSNGEGMMSISGEIMINYHFCLVMFRYSLFWSIAISRFDEAQKSFMIYSASDCHLQMPQTETKK